MLNIWGQKQPGCRREAFFVWQNHDFAHELSIFLLCLCVSYGVFVHFLNKWTEHCVLSLFNEDWQVLLDTVLKEESMVHHVNSNTLTISSRVFYLRDIQLHRILFNARKKLRNYIHRSCPVNLSTKAFFFYQQTLRHYLDMNLFTYL